MNNNNFTLTSFLVKNTKHIICENTYNFPIDILFDTNRYLILYFFYLPKSLYIIIIIAIFILPPTNTAIASFYSHYCYNSHYSYQ